MKSGLAKCRNNVQRNSKLCMWLFLISYILCSLSLGVYDEGPLLTVGGNCGILNGVCVPGKSLYIPLLDLSKEMLTVTECVEIFYCSVICI